MAMDISRLTAAVDRITTVKGSIVSLLEQLSQLLRDNAGDAVAINALADQVDAHQNDLVAAVLAHTPAAPTPPPA